MTKASLYRFLVCRAAGRRGATEEEALATIADAIREYLAVVDDEQLGSGEVRDAGLSEEESGGFCDESRVEHPLPAGARKIHTPLKLGRSALMRSEAIL